MRTNRTSFLFSDLLRSEQIGDTARDMFSWTIHELEDLFATDWNPKSDLAKKWMCLLKYMFPTVSVFDGKKDDLDKAVTVSTEAHVYWYMIYAMKDKCFDVSPESEKTKGKPKGVSITQKYRGQFNVIFTMVKEWRDGKPIAMDNGGTEEVLCLRNEWLAGAQAALIGEKDEPLKRSGAKKRKRQEKEPVGRVEFSYLDEFSTAPIQI